MSEAKKPAKVIVYKKGGKQKIWGVSCETKCILKSEIKDYQDKGYITDPKKLK